MEGMSAKVASRLIGVARQQIKERRIPTPDEFTAPNTRMESTVTDRTKNPSMWVVHFKWRIRSYGSRVYGSRIYGDYLAPRWTHASFLCGHADKQDWAVRVPGTITTVQKALDYITPGEVKRAQRAGKKVFRQGDIYFFPLRIYYNDLESLWGTNHNPAAVTGGITITHPQHPSVTLPLLKDGQAWRAVRQTQMGNWGRANAD
jgi:hypothetical protein